jgi:hypothetical protein
MPNETPAITMALIMMIWFLAVLVAVGALAWRQAHPKPIRDRASRATLRHPAK